MKNKRKVYEVLEEKISPDNIVSIGELLALGALKYMCGHKMLHGMYADLARDIANKDVEGYVLTESYDLAQEYGGCATKRFATRYTSCGR